MATSDAIDRKLREQVEVLAGLRGDKSRRAVRWSDLAATGGVTSIISSIAKKEAGNAGSGGGTPIPEDLEGFFSSLKTISPPRGEARAAANAARAAQDKANSVEDDLAEAVTNLTADYQTAVEAAGQSVAAKEAAEAAQAAAEAARETAESRASAANAYAEASQTSAAASSTHADAAGQSAAAAALSSQSAETAASTADAARQVTVEARDEVAATAADAREQLDLATQTVARGQGVLSDPFLTRFGAGGFESAGSGGILTRVPNENHLVGNTWAFEMAAGDVRGMRVASDVADSVWVGPTNADGYVVEVDFTLVSGALQGAGLIIDWNSAGADNRSILPFSQMTRGPVAPGKVQTAIAVIPRPVMAGVFVSNEIFFYAGSPVFAEAVAAKHIRVHRVAARVAMAEELGRGVIEAVFQAELQQNYLTRTDTQSAIAASETNLRASIRRKNPDFEQGSLDWTSSLAGTPAAAVPVSGWSFSQVPKEARIQANFSPYLCQREAIACAEGDAIRVNARLTVEVGNGGTGGDLPLIITWLNADYQAIGATQGASRSMPVGSTRDLEADFGPAPANAAYARVGIYVHGGRYGGTPLFRVHSLRGDNITAVSKLEASINETFITKVDSAQAISNAITTYNASVAGGLTASVSQQAIAISKLGSGAQAGYVLRAVAGQGAAGIRLVAWDDPTGAGGAIQFDADYIVANGTISVDKLLVGIGGNLMTNTRFTDGIRGYQVVKGGARAAADFGLRQPGQSYAGGSYPTLVIYEGTASTDGYAYWEYRPLNSSGGATPGIPVSPGQVIELSAQLATVGCQATMLIQFRGTNGALISSNPTFSAYSGNPGQGDNANPENWQRFGNRVTVPAGAAYAALLFQKGVGTGANSYLFIHKPQLILSHLQAKALAPYRPDGTVLISGEGIIADSLTATNLIKTQALITHVAQIGDSVVQNQHIGNIIQSSNFVSGSNGWRIDKSGDAEFSRVRIRNRELMVRSGTFAFEQLSISTATLLEEFVTMRCYRRYFIDTGHSVGSWSANDRMFSATIGSTGPFSVAGTGSQYLWTFEASPVAVSKYSGGATIHLMIRVWVSPTVTGMSAGTLEWKLREIT